MTKRLGTLIGGSLTVWLLAVGPLRLLSENDGPARRLYESLGGEAAVAYSLTALVLCLVPTALTLLWAGWAQEQSAEQQLGMVLGGTGARMIFVLGAALILHYSVPYFQQQSFWVWVLVFYLATLTLEMVLIVKARQAADNR